MKLIKLSQGKFSMVDDIDFERLNKFKWSATKKSDAYYAIRAFYLDNGKRTTIKMHREILGLKRGDGKEGEHADHNGLNNQRYNLREATRSQNMSNKRSKKNSTSKYLGVCWDKFCNRWMSQITHNGKQIKLGSFSNENKAAEVYNKRAIELHGEFANINIIK